MSDWLYTAWRGGCNNVQSDVRGRTLAPPGAAAFVHEARVRRLPDGRVEAQWWNDGRLTTTRRTDDGPAQAGGWEPFLARAGRIPLALLEQAESEAGNPFGSEAPAAEPLGLPLFAGAAAAGATLAPALAARATHHAEDLCPK